MDSISLLESMVAEQPANGKAWFLLGSEYVKAGRLGDALKAFSKALEHADDEMKASVLQQLAALTAQSGSPPADEPVQNRAGKGAVLQLHRGGRAEASATEEPERSITFADVGGLDELKRSIDLRIIKPFHNVGLFAKFRKKAGGGILLYGPPGCGKTFLARATAGECGAYFMHVRITDILDPYIGVSERNLRDLFHKARQRRPAILFFDELDALAHNRSRMSEHLRPLADLFLEELDGMHADNDRLLIMGATNLPWDVDASFKRPGRFDRAMFVAPPDEPARRAIFDLKLADRPAEGVDAVALARESELFSGADIESVVEQAAERVLDEILRTGVERPIRQADLMAALRAARPSTLEWLQTIKNYVRYANQDGHYDDVEQYLKRVKRLV